MSKAEIERLLYCDHCVGDTLHHLDDDDMWTCSSCGRWST
ncbi:CxxC motif protein [Natrialba phage PhiCh1]|uniref:CxxC motif protein n=1 Tax=Natrialba phage PhiCh1 TaxID=114777 RepID=A0A481W502_9CAUD|nr:CxxC motif protein [Natrialba phage PhiCh1]QBJ01259.1 CxxC motif protein [Natrialba phage PhiCh1]